MENRTLSNGGLNRKNSSEKRDPFGVAATLELSHDYTKEKTASVNMVSASAATTRTLKVGCTGEDVKELQKNLNLLGYNAGTPDGIYGNGTKDAVISFQKTYGLSADGIAGTNTLDAISTTVNRKNKNILSKGQVSSDVKDLQNNLISLGYLTGKADGVFGKNTENAVIAFQKEYGLTPDGLVGSATKAKIAEVLKSQGSGTTTPPVPSGNTETIQRYLDNLKNNTSLGLSNEKKSAMLAAAEKLLNDGYEVEFVAGVLGNIQNEGTIGKFESSAYISNPSAEPAYLKYMDDNFQYREKFSGKSIRDVGISAALELQKNAENSNFQGKFGLGMIQWTGSRTGGLLSYYQKYASSDKPTVDECIKAEINFMGDELKSSSYSYIYANWKNNPTAANAGKLICEEYENPKDKKTQSPIRAENAERIYNIMLGK